MSDCPSSLKCRASCIWARVRSDLPVSALLMTFDLRRLRLHGLIERIPHSRRHRVADSGLRVASFSTQAHSRILRLGLLQLFDRCPKASNQPITTAMSWMRQAFADLFKQAKPAPASICLMRLESCS